MVVSKGYVRLWEDTAKELTVLVCGLSGVAGMDAFALECNPFEFHEDSGERPFTLRRKRIQDIFQNEVLFEALAAVLNRAAGRTWPERYLEDVFFLDETGRPMTSRTEAEYVYRTASEGIISRYSGMSGIPLSHISLLAAMAYEKSDFEPGTQICFGARPSAAFSVELGNGSKGTVFGEENLKTIRKLLSGVKKDGNALYFSRRDSGGGAGGYRCEGYVKKSASATFRITFYGGGKWGFRAGGAKSDLFTVKNRQVQCFDAAFRYSLRRLEKEFRGCGCMSGFTSGGLRKFLEAARGQAHGTSVVLAPFSLFPAARERFEALERAGRGRSVGGTGKKDRDFYRAVTELARIDGSLVADLGIKDYRLAYFAVILDGRAGPPGSGWTSGGTRANSVRMFVRDLLRSELERAAGEEAAKGAASRKDLRRRLRSRKMPIAAVIFSEDGYVTPVLGSEWFAGLCGEAADKAWMNRGFPPHTP